MMAFTTLPSPVFLVSRAMAMGASWVERWFSLNGRLRAYSNGHIAYSPR